MKDLSRHIEYLLCEHDSVVIPGIGAFVTEELPARYYTEENIYFPPVRSVVLDTTITESDGKLENCLIHLHRVTHNVAAKWIDEYIETINQSLMDMGIMDMGTIGRLVLVDGKISFEVCEAGVNAPELYGLDSFHMPKLPSYARKGHLQKDPTHFTIRLRRTTVHRVMTAAAMLVVILTVIVPNYASFAKHNRQSQHASVESLYNLFTTNPHPISAGTIQAEPVLAQQVQTSETAVPSILQATEEETILPATDNSDDIMAVSMADTVITPDNTLPEEAGQTTENQEIEVPEANAAPQEQPAVQTVQTSAPSVQETPSPTLQAKGYCVVMASAITHKGADHLIEKLAKEGFTNAVKHTEKGMLRVVLAGYHNEEAARAELAVVRATDKLYSGSWIKFF